MNFFNFFLLIRCHRVLHREEGVAASVEAAVEKFSDLESDDSLKISDSESDSDAFVPTKKKASPKKKPKSADSDDDADSAPKKTKAAKTTKPRAKAAAGEKAEKPKKEAAPKKPKATAAKKEKPAPKYGGLSDDDDFLMSGSDVETKKRKAPSSASDSDSDVAQPKKAVEREYFYSSLFYVNFFKPETCPQSLISMELQEPKSLVQNFCFSKTESQLFFSNFENYFCHILVTSLRIASLAQFLHSSKIVIFESSSQTQKMYV